MVNFGAPETVPAKFAGRTFYQHNPQVTLMRTTPEECAELGRILAEKVNRIPAPSPCCCRCGRSASSARPAEPSTIRRPTPRSSRPSRSTCARHPGDRTRCRDQRSRLRRSLREDAARQRDAEVRRAHGPQCRSNAEESRIAQETSASSPRSSSRKAIVAVLPQPRRIRDVVAE